jgi:hypothetical protein
MGRRVVHLFDNGGRELAVRRGNSPAEDYQPVNQRTRQRSGIPRNLAHTTKRLSRRVAVTFRAASAIS